ncbi:MAG: hypothetical protein MK078_05750 [Crocinitomicaceae bacterium]|nr:hypothetical protein [Crocinitomicaceae bacterium]
MNFKLIFLNILVFLTSLSSFTQDSIMVESSNTGNPFKAPKKDFGMFYWGVGIGLLLLLVALIYRWRTRERE